MGLAGAAGTAARVGLDTAADSFALEPSISTLVVNILGAFFLGLVTAHGLPSLSSVARSALSVGFLGAFTTFSAVSLFVTTATLATGVGFLFVQLSIGVFAAWGGWGLGRSVSTREGTPA